MAPPSPPRSTAAAQRKRIVRAAPVLHGVARRRTDATAAMLQRIGGQLAHVSGSDRPRAGADPLPTPSPRPTSPAGSGDTSFDRPALIASPPANSPRDLSSRPTSPKEEGRPESRVAQATWAPIKGTPAPRPLAPPPFPAGRSPSPPKPLPPRPPAFTSPDRDMPCLEMECQNSVGVSYAAISASSPAGPKITAATHSPAATVTTPAPRPRTTPPSAGPSGPALLSWRPPPPAPVSPQPG
ncbi:hypothetical protein KGM_203465 [Danaus plexippus plexippus]|uniref:Uncharacterized protein n=1 Tax=Danaus plexippus plexippus TaxID=278856 RepID=A0A212EYX3_DANPL|nr:hypothetical protein KGM_203465 [Danaus plexippus plexippus]